MAEDAAALESSGSLSEVCARMRMLLGFAK
jgi:hypothetical protein